MNPPDESFTISSKETLLPIQQTSKPKLNKNLIPILFSLLTVLIFFAGSMILTIKHKDRTTPEKSNSFDLNLYYCHLTKYPNLCYNSMSSILNLTAFHSNPNLIFSASIQIALNQLQHNMVSINKSLSLSTNNSQYESSLRECESLVKESLSQLNGSMSLMFLEWGIDSLTYQEIDSIKSRGLVASNNTYKCVRALRGIDHELVEEVKHGVEMARKYIINSVELVNAKDEILDHFYNSLVSVESGDYYYYYDYSFDRFDFNFVVCLYGGLYLFLALLYFLFWQSD